MPNSKSESTETVYRSSAGHPIRESTLRELHDLAHRLQEENRALDRSLINRIYYFVGMAATKKQATQ